MKRKLFEIVCENIEDCLEHLIDDCIFGSAEQIDINKLEKIKSELKYGIVYSEELLIQLYAMKGILENDK